MPTSTTFSNYKFFLYILCPPSCNQSVRLFIKVSKSSENWKRVLNHRVRLLLFLTLGANCGKYACRSWYSTGKADGFANGFSSEPLVQGKIAKFGSTFKAWVIRLFSMVLHFALGSVEAGNFITSETLQLLTSSNVWEPYSSVTSSASSL